MSKEQHHQHHQHQRQYDDGNSISTSSSSSLNSSSHNDDDDDDNTEDDHAIATILAADDNSVNGHHRLGRRLSHLDSIPVDGLEIHDLDKSRICLGASVLSVKGVVSRKCWSFISLQCSICTHTPRVITEIPDANDATFDHESLSERLATYGLAELQIEGDGNCQFRALADQLFRNPDYHKYVRKKVVKQLKRFRKLYESYVPMRYKDYLKKMKKLGEWGDHVTLQAAADQFGVKICLVTSFRDTCYIEILPKDKSPSKEIWLSFWSEVHYNSLYETGEVPTRAPKKRHWLF